MQAARGTSLSDAETEAHPTGPTGALRLLFVAVALVMYGADQGTKALAAAHLTPGEPRQLVGSLLRLNLTRNAGAAFSTGKGCARAAATMPARAKAARAVRHGAYARMR